MDKLKNTRQVESKYLHKGKELMQIVLKQQAEIEQSELFPSGEDKDVHRLRAELLKHGNELSAGNERIYQLEFKLDGLSEEKRLLEKEFSRLPKKEEVEKQMKDYSQEIEDLKVEIAQRTHEGKNLKGEFVSQGEQVHALFKEVETLERNEQALKVREF